MIMRMPLWVVRLERDRKRVTEHIAASDADSAMRLAQRENHGHEVLSVERVNQIGVRSIGEILIEGRK